MPSKPEPYVWRVTWTEGWGTRMTKVYESKRSMAGRIGLAKYDAYKTARDPSRDRRLRILRIERAPLDAFEDVTEEFDLP